MACCSCQTSPVPSSCRVAITSADLAELLYIQGLDSNLCTKFELLTDAVHLVDCAGNPISINTPIVTCADFAAQLCAALAALDSAGDVELGVTELVGADCQTYTVPETPLTVIDSDCINLTASGDFGHTLTADVIISPNEGNTITCEVNGLFVPTAEDTTVVVGSDTDCISVTVVEGPDDTFTVSAEPIISPNANNAITCIGNGLFANTPTPITVLDTASVDLTLTGGNVLSADVIISPNAGNQISIEPNGLFVPDTIINVLDSDCLDLEIIEGPANTFLLTGDLVISPDAGNLLSCTPDGLFSGPATCDQIVATFDPTIVPPPPGTQFLASDCNTYTIPQAEAPDCETIVAAFTPVVTPLAANAPILAADCNTYPAPGVSVLDTSCINMTVTKPGNNYVVSAEPIIANTYPGYDPGCNGLQCTLSGLAAPPDIFGAAEQLPLENFLNNAPVEQDDVFLGALRTLNVENTSDCRDAILTIWVQNPEINTSGTPTNYSFRQTIYRDFEIPGVVTDGGIVLTTSQELTDTLASGTDTPRSDQVFVYILPPGAAGTITTQVIYTVPIASNSFTVFAQESGLAYTLVTI